MPVLPDTTLRISVASDRSYLLIDLRLDEPGQIQRTASVRFSPHLPAALPEDLQWYLEKFLNEHDQAALTRARQIRESIKQSGKRLFRQIFQANTESRDIWRRISTCLARTRIEVYGTSSSNVLWELLCDPTTSRPLCLSAANFVRSVSSRQESTNISPNFRLLLVISRPTGTADIEFRAIASTIYDSLRTNSCFEVEVLRPPTYDQITRRLREAADANAPFDLVHFDGHGIYQETGAEGVDDGFAGGYIIFEHPDDEHGHPISGSDFGAVAFKCGIKAVVLNACRSAYQQSADVPSPEYRPASSFAHSLLTAGVPSVVAMSFNVYVSSAKSFMEEFYRRLQEGQPLGVAATLARKSLWEEQNRFHQDSSQIDDWLVPAIYQSGGELQLQPAAPQTMMERRRPALPPSFPPIPEFGFVGSDDALLQIDRSFDSCNVVLLYGLAGAGKSAASVEFSTWYRETNPNIQVLLFTSFEASPSLSEVLANIEPEIGMRVEGLDLSNIGVQERIVRALASKGAFWIWDNVETVGAMGVAPREAFAAFIRQANTGGLRILLTARDRQTNWLEGFVCFVEIPRLRLSESIEYTKRILTQRQAQRFDANIWQPLLEFADGNPLTLRVSISSYLTTTRKTSQASIESYVRELRLGVTQFEDAGSDRGRSLSASLNYGLSTAFTPQEMKLLSLLSLFRTYVNSFTIWIMCRPITDTSFAGMPEHDFSWTIPEMHIELREEIEAVFNKAVDLGMLRKPKDYNYWLHPAIHIHLQPFFESSFADNEQKQIARRAFAEAQGVFAIQFTRHVQEGLRAQVINAFTNEYDNLEHALYLSHANGWLQAEVGLLHGFNALLLHQGRYAQWRRVYLSVWEDFIGPDFQPLPGTEKWWSFVIDHRLRIAMEDSDLDIAEKIARLVKSFEEAQTQSIPRQADTRYGAADRKRLHDLAISTGRLADVLRLKNDGECVPINQQAIAIYKLLQDTTGVAIRHLNLGHCYKNVISIRDLAESEAHYRSALENYPDTDDYSRAQCMAQISMIWVDQVEDQIKGSRLTPTLKTKLENAIEQYEDALEMLPLDALGDLANMHNNLASALRFHPKRNVEAIGHVRKAAQYAIAAGRYYEAATMRGNLAQMFAMLKRSREASAAAEQALGEFRALGITKGSMIRALKQISRRGF